MSWSERKKTGITVRLNFKTISAASELSVLEIDVFEVCFFLHHVDCWVHVCHLTGEEMALNFPLEVFCSVCLF